MFAVVARRLVKTLYFCAQIAESAPLLAVSSALLLLTGLSKRAICGAESSSALAVALIRFKVRFA